MLEICETETLMLFVCRLDRLGIALLSHFPYEVRIYILSDRFLFLAVHHLTIFCISRCPQQYGTFQHTEVLWLTGNSWKAFELTRNSVIWIFLNLLSPRAEFLASESSSADCQDSLYRAEELFWRMCPENGHEVHTANPPLPEGIIRAKCPQCPSHLLLAPSTDQ